MPRFLLVALNGPTNGEGDEERYNDWYDNTHADDLLSIDGAKSVRRFRIVSQNRIDKPYLNVTEFEAESADALHRQLGLKASDFTGSYMDRDTSVFVLGEEITRAPAV